MHVRFAPRISVCIPANRINSLRMSLCRSSRATARTEIQTVYDLRGQSKDGKAHRTQSHVCLLRIAYVHIIACQTRLLGDPGTIRAAHLQHSLVYAMVQKNSCSSVASEGGRTWTIFVWHKSWRQERRTGTLNQKSRSLAYFDINWSQPQRKLSQSIIYAVLVWLQRECATHTNYT